MNMISKCIKKIKELEAMVNGMEEKVRKLEEQDESAETEQIKKLDAIEELCQQLYARQDEFAAKSATHIERLKSVMRDYILSQSEVFDESYVYQFICRMRNRFCVMDTSLEIDPKYVREGRSNDGGYVMLNDFLGKKTAYSFGISYDVSWDKAMAEKGFQVYMYDHTIEGLVEDHPNFHFQKIGLAGTYSEKLPYLKTLPMLIRENGHADDYDMILKMDIEGCEWDVLNHVDEDTMRHFSQIVFELHALTHFDGEKEIASALEKLNRTHQLVHIHANNYDAYILQNGKGMPDTIEAVYLLREKYPFVKSARFFPTELDQPCNPYVPDITLGCWNDDSL